MKLKLAFGRHGLDVELPAGLDYAVYETRETPVPADPDAVIAAAMARPIGTRPLAELARGRKNACIVISDVTRPVPNALILPQITRALESAGMRREDILILVGTGIHRPNLGDELRAVVGDFIMDHYRIENHYSRNAGDQVFVGRTRAGIPVHVNRLYLDADLKIMTGLIEPHMWAGFSGGRKGILPGISSVETMKHMHGYQMIAQPGLGYGRLKGNPFHEAGVEVARLVGCDFLVNVTISGNRRLTGCYCGDILEAHLAGCEALRPFVEHELPEPVDVVLISGGGLPLDHVLYQSPKGMVVADALLQPDGSMILASECSEGVGSPDFTDLMDRVESVDQFMALLRQPGFFVVDQWCAQQIYEIRRRHEMFFYTTGVSKQQLTRYLMTPVESVEDGIARCLKKHGPKAKFAIFPEGPYVYGRIRGR